MPTPNPLAPVKGAGTTLWLYTGTGNAFANPLSDIDWNRLAKIKELTPGEMTAESYDDTYLERDGPGGKICWRYLVYPRLEAGRRRAKRPGRMVY